MPLLNILQMSKNLNNKFEKSLKKNNNNKRGRGRSGGGIDNYFQRSSQAIFFSFPNTADRPSRSSSSTSRHMVLVMVMNLYSAFSFTYSNTL